jgi:hypothetical protein
MNNIYYNPESCGLEIFAEEDIGGSYEFDTLCVWREKKTGFLYWAQDSGCSCPTPFEGRSSIADLTPMVLSEFRENNKEYGVEIYEKVKKYLESQPKE